MAIRRCDPVDAQQRPVSAFSVHCNPARRAAVKVGHKRWNKPRLNFYECERFKSALRIMLMAQAKENGKQTTPYELPDFHQFEPIQKKR